MRLPYSLILGVAAWFAFLSACKPEHAPAPPTTTSAVANAASAASSEGAGGAVGAAAVTDAELAAALEASIARDPVLSAQGLRVSVDDGAVTLRGTVTAIAGKERAAQLVSAFKGATLLANAIVVGGPTRSDAEIAKGVTDALKRDPATRRANVQVTVSHGAVSLHGAADSSTQRRLFAEDAARVPGVGDVKLEVTSTSSPRGGAEIVADVADRFGDDARLDGARLSVSVHGRSAAISGLVGSLAQRDAATEDAFVSGVDEVDVQGVRVDWREADRTRRATEDKPPTDDRVLEVVRRRVADDVRVAQPRPSVRVDHGVVTLSGNVADFRAARIAARDAYDVRGVWNVVDQMTVSPAVREDDATVQAQAQANVYNDPSTPDARDVQISTASAKVTLRGVVASPEERLTIASNVEQVPGVVAVDNQLQVKGYDPATHVVPPASLRGRVTDAIFWDPRVGGAEVTPQVAPNGDVDLTGVVHTLGEARSAGEDALRAGAPRVVNRLQLSGDPAFSPSR